MDMAYDFRDLKDAVDDVLPDHKYLNEYYDFNPTAENLVKEIYHRLKFEKELPVINVTLWESKDAGASYP
jgi:6-pyruvoyltetrahydropterin/6-carboxytetrahydropterin synthase